MKTEEELKQIAKDLFAEKIFTSEHIRKEDLGLSNSIFMPLMFLSKENADEMIKNNITIIYEYFSEAMNRSINGYPMFMSYKTLRKEEWTKIIEIYDDIKKK